MSTSSAEKSIKLLREAVSKAAPFSTFLAKPIGPSVLSAQNLQTDKLGRVTHVEGQDKEAATKRGHAAPSPAQKAMRSRNQTAQSLDSVRGL